MDRFHEMAVFAAVAEEEGFDVGIRIGELEDSSMYAIRVGYVRTVVCASPQVSDEVEKGTLRIILEEFEPPPKPVNILHREGSIQSAKVRAFVDLMAEKLRYDRRLNPS